MLVRQVLAGLIDRSLLVQEAKRHIKDKKMLEQIYEEADKNLLRARGFATSASDTTWIPKRRSRKGSPRKAARSKRCGSRSARSSCRRAT